LPFTLDPTTIANQTTSGILIRLVANETQAIGDACYINSSGNAQIAKADVIANANVFVVCADASISASATGNYLLWGLVRNDSSPSWTVGSPTGLIYLSTTGTTTNTLTQTAPTSAANVVQVLGVALTTHIWLFKELTTVELTGS